MSHRRRVPALRPGDLRARSLSAVDAVRPDYAGPDVAGVVPGAARARDRSTWLPAPVAGAERVVLLVLDGLGWERARSAPRPAARARRARRRADHHGRAVDHRRPRSPRSRPGSPPRSTASSASGSASTARCSTSCAGSWPTAAAPPDPFDVQRHARVPRPAGAGRHQAASSAPPASPARTCAAPTFLGWQTHVGARRALRGAGRRRARRSSTRYYPGVDEVAHEFGLARRVLPGRARGRRPARRCAARRAARRRRAARHRRPRPGPPRPGRLDRRSPRSRDGRRRYAGDGRFRYLHARTGARRGAARGRGATSSVGDDAWVFTRERAARRGLARARTRAGRSPARIGDVVLAARDAGRRSSTPTLPQRGRAPVGATARSPPPRCEVPLLAGARAAADER